ncbi:MAG: carboxylating nicotinate-nucleotide diphosphorylase [Candidatus Omnitrophica bacterium]|nr:carboxylating nicotinate-nucleotide diphosphorylase [Candidatus Omnitrophota bacterium]
MKLDKERVLPIIKAALKEDIGKGDITTQALVGKFQSGGAAIVAKEDCVVCGLQVAEWTMAQIDYSVRFKPNCDDGVLVGARKELAFLEGRVASILRAERTMLNFLSFLSAIATRTKKFVDKAKPYGVKVMDTRKTLPLLRYLEKYAVAAGGGSNHRMGLYDQALIKDNHIKALGSMANGQGAKMSLMDMVRTVRNKSLKGTVVEIEVGTIAEFEEVLPAKPDIIMLDNMSPSDIRACVEVRKMAKFKPLLEASGGINLDNIESYAKTGIEMISAGSLTASVKSIDISLETA